MQRSLGSSLGFLLIIQGLQYLNPAWYVIIGHQKSNYGMQVSQYVASLKIGYGPTFITCSHKMKKDPIVIIQ